MTLALYFNLSKFPRSLGRDEWKEIWRWKRVTEKKLEAELEQQRFNLIAFGTTMPSYIKRDIIDQMINPPLLIHDKQQL